MEFNDSCFTDLEYNGMQCEVDGFGESDETSELCEIWEVWEENLLNMSTVWGVCGESPQRIQT